MIEENDASKLIDALGGTSAVGRITGRRMTVVSNWKMRGRIPAQYFLVIRDAGVRAGVEVSPDVFGMADGEASSDGQH